MEFEQKSQTGTPSQGSADPTVAEAHAKHEQRRELAEDVQADMEYAQSKGASPREAKAAAQARNAGHSPEDRRAAVPENRSDNRQTGEA